MNPNTNAWQFIGEIDEVALYDRPLSAEEIRNHYQSILNITTYIGICLLFILGFALLL